MDDSTADSDQVYWDSMMVEAARRHPLAMAAWLLADCAVNWSTAAMDKLEEQMRAAQPATR